MVKFDDILSEIDEFGRFQKIKYGLICLAALLPPICTYLHSFIAANPPHRFVIQLFKIKHISLVIFNLDVVTPALLMIRILSMLAPISMVVLNLTNALIQ